ncbi:MAG: DUF2752 domain-containing protein [Mucilaginibacter sp.]
MYPLYVFCSHLSFIKWLQNHLLACPFKKLTGIDCPGCGFQRSFLALIQGNLKDSLHLYPATIPLLTAALFVLLDGKYHFDQKGIMKMTLYMVTGAVIIGSYMMKMTGV